MHAYICTQCCNEFSPSENPPANCPICTDPRQYVNPNGQSWTTHDQLAQTHSSDIRELEPGLLGIGVTPNVGIAQRALLNENKNGGIMWDSVPLIDDKAIKTINAKGGVKAMTLSHPHLYSAMVTNSERLGDVPIYIPEADREWVMYPHKNTRYWSGDTLELGDGITLYRTGGHFDGSSMLHWPQGASNKGALLTGDTIMVATDPDWLTFTWSTPNFVPLNPRAMRHIVSTAEKLAFDRIYAGWWGAVTKSDAKAKLKASEERILWQMRQT